ncbi:unnamed protein product [Linum tenue]|uniref:Pentatricopeptide repeat-containing protein n=1 Tax=Linum tenue TaxID=586396 RepID=A0AAV0R5X6_9ROSI|nr:unnamed protein product [Linum tenue]
MGIHSVVFVGTALLDFYAKCGDMEDSLLVFHKLPDRNVVSWNAVICGLARNGRAKDALMFFDRMVASGFNPNDVTLLGVLWACKFATMTVLSMLATHILIEPEIRVLSGIGDLGIKSRIRDLRRER